MTNPTACTPHYVLLENGKAIGVGLALTDPDSEVLALYGFSDKGPYDIFCAAAQRKLCPYPLVKGFVQRQIDEADGRIQYMALDASSPDQPCVSVATMQSIRDALTAKQECVAVNSYSTLK